MKKIVINCFVFLLLLSCGNSDEATEENQDLKNSCPGNKIGVSPTGNNNVLIWSDEFDLDGSPCSDNWTYDIGSQNGGWGNNESQYYTRENATIKDGILIITAKKETYRGYEYTSTRMKTQGKFNFTYGKVEVRAKLPTGGGTWPAIWMLGSNITDDGWPACGEIDIMEHVGNAQDKVHSSLHTISSSGNTINTRTKIINNVSTEFHIYSTEWSAEKIVFSIDEIPFYTYNPSTKTLANWPFTENQFIILNIAMGGSFGGAISPSFIESTMEIDYVRVFQ